MKILFVSAEVSPFAKVGGLADVAGSLPWALRELGHDARVVMPLYRMIEEDPRWRLHTNLDGFEVKMSDGWMKQAVFKETEHEGAPVGFIGTDQWFEHSVDSESLYQPGGMQHLFFSTAVLEAMERLDWIPDVVHCNDWHTGFLPVIMREKRPLWDEVATVFTIHNLAYQGEFGPDVLDVLGLPRTLFRPEKVEAWGRVNFLKSGCAYSDRVNTVSENYAGEIQSPEYGCTLEGLMTHLAQHGRLSGILNGIDTKCFDPATDRELRANFSAEDITGKARCKAALLKEVGWTDKKKLPLIGLVSRLSSQKGLDLILEAAEALVALPIRLIVQGLGDPWLAEKYAGLEKKHPDRFKFVNRFDAGIAQRIYGGCDGFLMPSRFEPCGLGQMIAMRYGTIPIVRATGGLADTVIEGRNGFVFQQKSAMSLLAAVERFVGAYGDSHQWTALVKQAMREDHSWNCSAASYADLYLDAVEERAGIARTA